MKKTILLFILVAFMLPVSTMAQTVFLERFDGRGANIPVNQTGILPMDGNTAYTSFDCSGTVALELLAIPDNIVYIPIFPGSPINTLAMSFTTHPSQTVSNGYLDVGYLIDRMDPYSFSIMETYNCSDSDFLSNCSVEKLVSFDSAPSYAQGMAFRYRPATESSNSWFLDNIQVFTPNGCDMPSSISITNITTTSAVMNVTMAPSTTGYIIYDLDEDQFIDTCYTSTYTFNSLTPSTIYDYIVYPLCSSGRGGRGVFVSFTTECAVPPIPYHENFNNCLDNGNVPLCWLAPLPSTNTCGVLPVGNSEIFGNSLVTNNGSDLLVLPALEVGSEVGVVRLAFMYVGGQQNDSVRVGMINNAGTPSTFTEFAVVRQDSTGDYTNDLRTYYTYINTSLLPDTVRFALWAYGSARFDEIDIRRVNPSCNMPESSSIDVSNDTITLYWQNPDNSTMQNFRVLYSTNYSWPGLPGYTDSDTTTVFVSQDTTLTLIGLTPRTVFYFWVQPECGDSSDWYFMGQVEAQCPTGYNAPYYLDFTSGYPNLAIPECWNVLSSDAMYSRPFVFNRDGIGALELMNHNNSSTNFIAMPYIRLQANNMMVTIQANTTFDAEYLEVGYITDPTDMSGFVVLDSIHSEEIRDFDIYTSSVPDSVDTIYIAFRYNKIRTARIYTVLVDEIPTCIRPYEMTADTVGHNFATLTIDGDSTTIYEVRYSTDNNVDSANTMIVSSLTFTIDSLQPLTTYYTWVRTICGSIYNQSEWRTGASFTTTCGADPCPLNIQLYEPNPNMPVSIAIMMGCGVNAYYHDSVFLCKIGNTENQTSSYDETLWVCPEMAPINLHVDAGEYGAFGGWMFQMGINVTLADSTVYNYDATIFPHGSTFLVLDHPCPTCPTVESINIDSVATDLVAISWTPADSTDSIFYIYLDNVMVDSVFATYSYTFTGLTQNTGYSIGVANDCNGTPSTIVTRDTVTVCDMFEPCPIRVSLNDAGGTGWIFNNHVQVWSNNYMVADVHSAATAPTIITEDVYVCSGDSVRIVWVGVGNSAIIWSEMNNIIDIYNGDGTWMGGDTAIAQTPDHEIVTFMPVCPCDAPTILSTEADSNSITVRWDENDSTEVQISTDENFTDAISVFTNLFSHTFDSLTENTVYYFRLRTLCPIGGRTSEWVEIFDTTLHGSSYVDPNTHRPCPAPEGLGVLSTTYTSATVGWHPTGDEPEWEVAVTVQGEVRLDTVADTIYTITGLWPEVPNYISVRALCGENHVDGEWSDTITFFTDVCQPVPATSIGIGDLTSNSASVSWQTMENSLGYELFRRARLLCQRCHYRQPAAGDPILHHGKPRGRNRI